ncbi:MAG: hypothetical protein FWF28_04780 [Micrococcales bacterium]|nr:hypothetical protein [Micrococcales bacterium]
MSAQSEEKVQISVRLERSVAQRLDRQIAQARRAGRRVTKEKLVADAIVLAFPEPESARLPVHRASWLATTDPRSTTALLDLLDEVEASL